MGPSGLDVRETFKHIQDPRRVQLASVLRREADTRSMLKWLRRVACAGSGQSEEAQNLLLVPTAPIVISDTSTRMQSLPEWSCPSSSIGGVCYRQSLWRPVRSEN